MPSGMLSPGKPSPAGSAITAIIPWGMSPPSEKPSGSGPRQDHDVASVGETVLGHDCDEPFGDVASVRETVAGRLDEDRDHPLGDVASVREALGGRQHHDGDPVVGPDIGARAERQCARGDDCQQEDRDSLLAHRHTLL